MAKQPTKGVTADLTVGGWVLLFCAASNSDWEHAGIPGRQEFGLVRALGVVRPRD